MVAAAQRGLVHRSQLAVLGIGRGSVAHRISTGTLHRVLPSVLAVGHPALPPLGAETAALLHVGEGCALSHRTAAALWGLVKTDPQRIEVTVAGRKVRHRSGLHVYHTTAFDLRDVRLRHGLPVTAPARTMIDFAALAGEEELVGALAEARVLRLVTDAQLEAAMERAPLRTGVARLRAVMHEESGLGRQPTRNDAERLPLSLVAQAGLPPPSANARLLGMEVDLLWKSERLVVEFDGWDAHGHRAAFERDHRRGQILNAAGYDVFRVTWRQLVDEPMAVVVRIAQTLAKA